MAVSVDCVCLVLFVINLCTLDLAVANHKGEQIYRGAEAHPAAAEFTKHALVKPRIYHGREKRQISTTREPEGGGGHAHHVTVDYNVDDEHYILDLRLNRDLIPKGYFRRHTENGKHVVNRPTTVEEVEICQYKGKVRGVPDSWVALSTCDDKLRGVVYDGKDMHYIENSQDSEHHFLYKHSDLIPDNNKTCGYDGGPDVLENQQFNRILRYKRSSEILIRGPYNADKQSRYVELVLVVDNRKYRELGENKKRVEQHCKDIANIINGVYSPLNIYIALIGVVIWAEGDEITLSSNSDTTLTNFLRYRRETLIKQHPNDNAQLLTKNIFENGMIGKALKGPICTYEYSGGVNIDISPVLGLVASNVAHVIGHNFGMEHDTTECSCKEERCIMAPSSSTTPPTHWSSCSLEYLALAFEHGMDYCLRNKPGALFDSPVCGNGFVEPGEQCDCGLPEHCDNSCCNSTTCMLHTNATCATGECCDLNTCKPKKAGTVCRSADYECDLPEYCTGQSEFCPDDVFKMDTEVCDHGRAYCYHGFCRTRSDQCKLLWGSTGNSSHDQCYKMNTKGSRHGNCGYNKLNQTFFKCQDENVLCGMLQCKHLNERLEFGMESVSIISHSFMKHGDQVIQCKTAIVDLGLDQVDPGLVPDGAKCGEGKMCVNQKCMPVDSLRTTIGKCPKDCSGNGICNSLGHCHCKEGFAPPHCDYPGTGGSTDSGPASDPNAKAHPAATEFTRHALVKPRIYHGREKRQISTTREPEGDGGHAHHITVDYDLDDEHYILDLRLNRDLIPKGYFRRHTENGKHVVIRPTTVEEVEICQYKGKVRGVPDSWVALSTCDDKLRGVVYDGKDMHYIENSQDSEHHFLYKHSDLIPDQNKTCGYGGGHDVLENQQFNRMQRYKRSSEILVRGPYNADKQSSYVELVLVVDNREYRELGENKKRVEQHCKEIANIINGLYSPLNIYIALIGVVIWAEGDEITFSTNGDTTLTNFLHYRRETLIKQHPNDNAQLLTKNTFENGVVGKALKGPICTYEYSGGVNTDHSPVVGLVATTVAHEMGHNFGMEHDTTECSCKEERCIMAPSSSTIPPTHWSSCSLEYLALAFEHGMDYCLRNKPVALFDSPVCGNGFVEPGEQCDCGLPEHCDNSCCNSTTCMLHKNATCATGECCDLNTCKPKNAGTVCRSADYECDLPEYCTGQSEFCPDDIFKMDTEVCDHGRAYCYHGFCRTRSDQCKLLWGNTGNSSHDQCYKMNTKGSRHGNCGYNKLNQSFFKCQDENVLCGMLHCKHLNERLEFGMESVSILSHSFINLKGQVIPCRTAIVDLGLNQVDPGLAPDGAKCGEGKMCVNQKCMPVDSLRTTIGKCPKDCSGNGICNSLGHCHCKEGFAPPHCDYPGTGGSTDSGPASDPNAHKGYVTAMFIVFLGVIPLIALIALLSYYMKHNLHLTWKKSPATAKSPQKSRSPPFSPESPKRIAEDNHSLLAEQPSDALGTTNEFFGQFKGFTLTPIKRAEKRETDPVRPAPPVPTVPSVPNVVIKKPAAVVRSNSSKFTAKPNSVGDAVAKLNAASTAPALPPLNPGSHPRPIISSPTLQNSTCTAKELLSPLRNAPKAPTRNAPEVPAEKDNVPATLDVIDVDKTEVEFKKPKETTINRIASFLKDKKPNVAVKVKNKSIDKEALRAMEISNPIPQTHIEIAITALPIDEPPKATVTRAQSMRSAENKPKLQSFGSMRDPAGNKRPVSIVNTVRPKSPPPPRPPAEEKKSASQYDDCLNGAPLAQISEANSPSSDNIYAVIEETPVTSPESKTVTSASTSNESFGLLGEIVSEIQNRNFDSIYSSSTLPRKKKGQNDGDKVDDVETETETYVNSPNSTVESVYSNMENAKSSASSTSSGYIHPSAVNAPVQQPKAPDKIDKTDKPKQSLTSFKSTDKPKTSKPEYVNPTGGSSVSSNETENKSKVTKATQPKVISRQTTPPNLRTRKPSPSRTSVAKTTSNSPDLVTSCSTSKASTGKGPDVVNNSVKKPVAVKPRLPSATTTPTINTPKNNKPALEPKRTISEVTKPPLAAKVHRANTDAASSKIIPTGAKIAAKQKSNVATLQQKFENKNNVKT